MTKDHRTIRELKEQMKKTDRLINTALRGMRLVNLTQADQSARRAYIRRPY